MPSLRRLRPGHYDYAAYLTFFAYAAGSVIIPVSLVELAKGLNFDLSEGGMAAGGGLQLGRATTMVLAMLVVGFLAGRWGTRKTLGGSVLLMSLGVGLCAVSPFYGFLLLAMLLAGVGEGVIEGLATPFVKNLHPDEPSRYINLSHAFWSVGILVTVLVSGWFLSMGYSWRVLTAVVSGVGVVAGLLILWPLSEGRRYPEDSTRVKVGEVWARMKTIFRCRRFWLFYAAMFLAGGGEFCLTFWSASHIQLHFEAGAWEGGLGVALFALAMVIGRFAAGYFVPQEKLRSLILFASLGGAVIAAMIPWVDRIEVFYGLLFLAGLATAPFWPSIQSYATDLLPELDSTLLLILLSCAGVPGCGVLTYFMGVWGDFSGSLGQAFLIVPVAYTSIWVLLWILREKK